MKEEIIQAIRQKGLLLEKDIYDILNGIEDVALAKIFLESLEKFAGQKVITKSALSKNFEFAQGMVKNISGEAKSSIEKVFVKMGLSFEISREKAVVENKEERTPDGVKYQIFYAETRPDKKLAVSDFTGNFVSRYQQLQRLLMNRADLSNLISINKISGERQTLSIIGMVSEKRMTKNKNLIVKVEDLTGSISFLVKSTKEELFTKAQELQIDDVVAIKASGSREMLFAHEIMFPDAFVNEKVKFEKEICVAFLSDVHVGSQKHLGKEFERFLEWLNSDDPTAQKIKFIFFMGDNVDGVGIFPGQENLLELKSMKEQYQALAQYLKRVPKHITMFMCPGQHDATRVAEPQPIIDKKYAPALFEIDNLVLVTNPAMVKLIEGTKELKVLMYHGASMHSFINEIQELREMKAHRFPAKVVKHLLKRRHLAPTHSSVVYIPNPDKDPLVIGEVPDIMCTGDLHRLDIETYNGILILAGSCWQSQTDFEEKVGNIPDPGKVSVLNLKTRELKIFDFMVPNESESVAGSVAEVKT